MHRVGIIPFVIKDDAVVLLFVTSQTRGRWILPKGRQKRSETQAEACHREGFEEAGVRGIVLEDFPMTAPISRQTANGIEVIPVTYYPYLVLREDKNWPERAQRQRHWTWIDEAASVEFGEDLLAVINQFQTLEPWITKAARAHLKGAKVPKPQRAVAAKRSPSVTKRRRAAR